MAPGHHHRKASKPGQVMALTLRYQHTHPEYRRKGHRSPGRIDVKERYHYVKGLATIFIPDKKLLEIVTGKSTMTDVERVRRITNYMLKKNKGDYKKAKSEISSIVSEMQMSHLKARFRDEEYMQHIAKLEGISKEELKEYISQSNHMSASAMALLSSYFQMAELMI